MPKDLYLLDTTNATRNYDNNTFGSKSVYHSYNVNFPFKTPISNLRKITLKSVEMPININQIRAQNNTITIGITFSIGSYSNVYVIAQIPDGFYYTTNLLSAINTAVSAVVTTPYGASIVFSQLAATYGSMCNITHNCTSLTIDNNPLTNYILGYTNTFTALSGYQLISNTPINVNAIDTCLYMSITNLPIMTNNVSRPYTFKIPLSGVSNGIGTLYFNDTGENQAVTFNNSTNILDKLNIVIYDRLGCVLTGFNNWTFTLLIEYDDNQPNQFLNINN